jgi:phosphoribosylformylglycinamidine synthase subunit PurS
VQSPNRPAKLTPAAESSVADGRFGSGSASRVMDKIAGMARVVVDVMPKPEILDPQGKAVTGALARLGFAGVTVRQGKRFELDVEGELTEQRLAEVQRAAETLLANTVIETFKVRVEGAESAGTGMEPQEVAAAEAGKGTAGAADAGVTESGDTVGEALAQSPDVATEAGKGTTGAADAGVTESGDTVGNPPAPPPEVATEPGKGTAGAADGGVKEPGDPVGNPSAPPPEVASDPATGGPEALDAQVEEPETGGASDGRPLEETVGDTDVQSPRKTASESAKEADSALDAGVQKTKETVEDSQAQPKRVIAPDAQAEPPDPASSGAR